jgi:hypothetical protein
VNLGGGFMDILKARCELRKMSTAGLFNLALNQKMSGCVIAGRPCCFYLQYKGCRFCASEVLGEGCQLERLEQSNRRDHDKEKINFMLPFINEMETKLLPSGKEGVEFKVYHRNHLTRSTVFLGKITERRRKERGNNLRDLLGKAIRQYSNDVEDPSAIFLLG